MTYTINLSLCIVPSPNIGTLGKYEQRWLWKYICIVYPFDLSLKKITKFEPIIEVKHLKACVWGGDLIVK